MSALLGVSWLQALATVLSTATMYLLVLLCVRLLGPRQVAAMSAVDLGAVMALGAVVGRTSLLLRPTLGAGVIATVTLFGMRSALSAVRHRRQIEHLVGPRPVLLMASGRPQPEALRSTGVSESDLRQRLRLAGVHSLDEVAAVVLETNGTVSVIRAGDRVDPWLVADVTGAGLLVPEPPDQDDVGAPEQDLGAPPY